MYFYRDADQKEIDFVFVQNMTLYPVEVKKTASPSMSGARAFECLHKFKKNVGTGAVVCFRQRHIPLSKSVMAINVGYL